MRTSFIIAVLSVFALTACDEVNSSDPAAVDTIQSTSSTLNGDVLNSGNRKFIQAMDICLNNFPNTLAVRQELRTSKFTSEGRFGGEEYFTAFNRNIIAFASTGTSQPICGFGRNGLRNDEAVLVVNATLVAKYGANVLPGDLSDDPELIAGWLVTTDNDTEVVVLVRQQISISGVYRGSLVYVAPYVPEQ